MTETLEVFETNGGRDSAGLAWGLEGDLFLYVIGAGIAAIALGMLCLLVLHWPLLLSLALAAAPVLLIGAYLKLFRIGKPRSYQFDWLQLQLDGSGVERGRQQQWNPWGGQSSTCTGSNGSNGGGDGADLQNSVS